MSAPTIAPDWADELKRRYLRGEASLFVLYGNVHDSVIDGDELVGISDFLAGHVLDKKETIIRYNVSTGCRFVKKEGSRGSDRNVSSIDGLEELLIHRAPGTVLPILERLLLSRDNVGLIIDYAEMIAPSGNASFFSEQDRLAVVTLQRWTLDSQLGSSDNIVILLTDAPTELHPKVVSNPRVATVKVPMPTFEQRRRVVSLVNPALDDEWAAKLADVTAGLRSVQIKSILQPPPAEQENAESRLRFIKSLVGDGARAQKYAVLTQGMSHEDISELIGVAPAAQPSPSADDEYAEVLQLIKKRKREVIERECFGLIEFVDPTHDFSVVGGIDAIKEDLRSIAGNIRAGHRSRVPMGLLFTGPMGTGKTFVAEAFVKESGLTGIKLKNFRSKWVGSTESNLEKILDVVRAIGNIIVIIDEGDRSFGSDGESDGGTGSRVVARLKEFMSDTSNRGRVLFILMTNRPDKLDIDIKRAGRLDRKIPFLYAQSAEDIEQVLVAQFRKHKLDAELTFPRDRAAVSQKLIGYSNADLEALALMANGYSATAGVVSCTDMQRAIEDYLPSRDAEMLEYMELLAVFEASSRRMLPAKYASVVAEDLQNRLAELELRCGSRR